MVLKLYMTIRVDFGDFRPTPADLHQLKQNVDAAAEIVRKNIDLYFHNTSFFRDKFSQKLPELKSSTSYSWETI